MKHRTNLSVCNKAEDATRHISLVIFTSILGVIAFLFAPIAIEGQTLLPDGSVIISPRSASPTDCLDWGTRLPEDDSVRIQQAIDIARGTVFFKAGCYYLREHSLHLRSGRTYMGEGSWKPPYASTLVQAPIHPPNPGMGGPIFFPIFSIDGVVRSVRIEGLAFDARNFVDSPLDARGIAAVSPEAMLVDSTLVGNYFWAELAECIDVPMVATRIERNHFGTHGVPAGQHRHIRSVHEGGLLPASGKGNWIVNNVFRSACCETAEGDIEHESESVLFQTRDRLHIVGNDFEDGRVDTTLRIHGASQVFVKGNWFENNAGQAQISLENVSQVPLGDYIVRMENNYYNMNGGNHYVFVASGATQVYMGYETGTSFASGADLTSPDAFQECYLRITGPFYLSGYMGTQTAGNPACH